MDQIYDKIIKFLIKIYKKKYYGKILTVPLIDTTQKKTFYKKSISITKYKFYEKICTKYNNNNEIDLNDFKNYLNNQTKNKLNIQIICNRSIFEYNKKILGILTIKLINKNYIIL